MTFDGSASHARYGVAGLPQAQTPSKASRRRRAARAAGWATITVGAFALDFHLLITIF